MTGIMQRKERILADLKAITDKDERLKAIIEYGKTLPALDDSLKIEPFLIKGCISRAWLVPELRDDRLSFRADSEAMIVKGIIALILSVYNQSSAEEIQSLPGDFLAEAGITDLLSMNRRSGVRNVMIMIQAYAAKLQKAD
ncbi:MAG: SufE family protein [Proteobacteria bacterium]|nr:SufE family protein [Pseudomonadota bacterium]